VKTGFGFCYGVVDNGLEPAYSSAPALLYEINVSPFAFRQRLFGNGRLRFRFKLRLETR